MGAPPSRPVTDALLGVFRAATARPVGDGALPEGGTAPLSILDPGPVTYSGPPMGDRFADAARAYTLRCVGVRHDQAGALHDRAVAALTDRTPAGAWVNPLAIAGQAEVAREVDASGYGTGTSADGMVTIVLRFTIHTTRA